MQRKRTRSFWFHFSLSGNCNTWGSVHITPRRNLKTQSALIRLENAALFLLLGLRSTLIRHWNGTLFLRLGLPSTLIRHENAAFFLQLGLPSTPVRHENGVFENAIGTEQLNMNAPAFRFQVDGRHLDNGAFQKRQRHDNHWCVFSVKPPFPNYSFREVWTLPSVRNGCLENRDP